MKAYLGQLQACLTQRSLDLGDHESVLSLLYEAYSDINPMPDPQIKADFQRLLRTPLREIILTGGIEHRFR